MVHKGIDRIETAWRNILKLFKGPFLAGEFSALDAFYAPVITRIQTYELPVSEDTAPYMQRIRQHPSVKKSSKDAIENAVFRDFEELYRFNSKDIPDPAEFFV